MKNKKLLKVFGLTVLITIVLSWIIPSTTIGSDGLTIGSISPTGFADIFATFDIITYYFAKPSILILLIGAFYGIINKTGELKALVNKLASMFKKKGWIFLLVTVLFYSITTALTGIYLPMVIFMPLSIAVLLELKYTKLDSLLATAGASTVGLLAIINSSVISSMTAATTNTYLIYKIVLLVVLTALVVLYILFVSKKKKINLTRDDETLVVIENRDAKKKYNAKGIALFVAYVLLFVIFVLGLTSWSENITTAFSNAYTAIQGVKIGNFAIFDDILGYFEVFGSWTYASLYPTVGFAIIVLAIIGKLSIKETFEGIFSGLTKSAGISLLVAFINVVLIFTLNSGFAGTFTKWILANENPALVTISSLITNAFMVSESYSAQYVLSLIYYSFTDTANMEFYGLICQFTFGFVSLVAPTSTLLMAGLYYLGEDYSKWIKYIWKLLIVIFVAMLIAIILPTLFA